MLLDQRQSWLFPRLKLPLAPNMTCSYCYVVGPRSTNEELSQICDENGKNINNTTRTKRSDSSAQHRATQPAHARPRICRPQNGRLSLATPAFPDRFGNHCEFGSGTGKYGVQAEPIRSVRRHIWRLGKPSVTQAVRTATGEFAKETKEELKTHAFSRSITPG